MSRKIIISKYENNTHWSIEVEDSFGQKHHLGYSSNLDKLYVSSEIEDKAMDIWSNEVQNEEDLLGKAIENCIEIDKKNGKEPLLD
tara:strand:- start:54 stop:311 length:258 start_codon:yes stop_codon:yes gene_type:complete